jgi:nicotinate-nucleotide adenylyltransferase
MAYTADGKKVKIGMYVYDRPWMSDRKIYVFGFEKDRINMGNGGSVSASSVYSSREALSTAKRVLIFGGTFDPIHNGHLIACRTVAEGLGIKRIILIPSGKHPYKHDITPPEIRMEMVEAAIEDEPLFEVCDCEFNRKGFSYSVDTAIWIKEDLCRKMKEVYWMIGADNVQEIPKWYRAEEFVKEVIFAVANRKTDGEKFQGTLHQHLIMERMHVEYVDTPVIEISSSMVRDRIKQDKSVKYLIPESVEDIIDKYNLYK